MTKKRHLTKRYKKHTKKYKKIRIRKTRIKRRGIKKTRRLNKKQRGGVDLIEIEKAKKIQDESVKTTIELFTDESSENINKMKITDIINELAEKLVLPHDLPKTTISEPLIKNYYNFPKTIETEKAKIQKAHDLYYNSGSLTNEQFIYLILTTNNSDISAYFDITLNFESKKMYYVKELIKKNIENHIIKLYEPLSKKQKKQPPPPIPPSSHIPPHQTIDEIANIEDEYYITNIINPSIFCSVFNINMQIMKYNYDNATNLSDDRIKEINAQLKKWKEDSKNQEGQKEIHAAPFYTLGAANEETYKNMYDIGAADDDQVYNPDDDEDF